jgi:hypothetical protein
MANSSAGPAKELDPFANTVQPFMPPAAPAGMVRSTANTSKSPDPFADLGGSASPDVHVPQAQPESQLVAKPAPAPIQSDAFESSGMPPQPPAPPQPAAAQPQSVIAKPLIVSEPPLSPEPLPAMPAAPQPASDSAVHDQAATATPVKQKQEVTEDAFADPAPTKPAQNRQPVMSMDAVQSRPSCAAPPTPTADNTVMAPQTVKVEAPPTNAAVSASSPVPAPASSELVTSTNGRDASPEAPKEVVPTITRPVARKAVPEAAAEEIVVQQQEIIRRHEATPSPTIHPGASEAAGVPNPMICDSNSVRGKFTGAGASADKTERQTRPKEAQGKPSPNAVPMSCTDADGSSPQSGQSEEASAHTAHSPKPLGHVVNAVAHRIGKGSVVDPFALEQTVDTSIVDPISIGDGKTQPLDAHGPRPLSAEQTDDMSPFAELMAVDTAAALGHAREETRTHREAWFGVGIGVGLAASLALWLRSRPKRERLLNG